VDARARWRILRLHVEGQVPLARLARETDVGLRTLERWHARYCADGYAGLETASRADAGSRRLRPTSTGRARHRYTRPIRSSSKANQSPGPISSTVVTRPP